MDQVEEIKQKVDIVELIQEHLPLKRAGRNYKGNCPFHGEKTPSFMVNPELQIFKCFGCGEGGDAYSFLQKIEGMDFAEALQALAKRTGITLDSYKPSQAEELRDRLLSINSMAAEYYHYLLVTHDLGKTALEYTLARGITDESIKRFKLGFAPDGWDYLIKYLTGKKHVTLEEMQRIGLAVEGKRYDRFRNRLMFPLQNTRGHVVGFAGRVLPGADEKSGGKYVNTPETPLYHKSDLLYALDVTRSDIKSAGNAIVVEGEIDAIASWQSGIKNVVAIKGSALTDKQVELLKRLCDTVVLSLDTDKAGDAASRRGIEIAEAAGLSVKIVILKGAKDPGELAITHPDEWREAVEKAVPIYDFYIQSAVERFGLDALGKKRIGQELLPIWAKIDDEIVKAHYIKQLAATLDVSEDDIRAQLGKVPVKQSTDSVVQLAEIEVPAESLRDRVEGHVVGMILHQKRFGDIAQVAPLVKTPFWKKTLESLNENTTLASLPAELRTKVEDVFLSEVSFDEKEWDKSVRRLEEIDVRQKIAEAKHDEDPALLKQLMNRLGVLTREV